MKIKLYILIAGLFTVPLLVRGQDKLEGKISDAADKDEMGLPGANVMWAGTTVGATTNAAGYFSIKRVKDDERLVISFVGYKTDTGTGASDEDYFTYTLHQQNEMDEVIIVGRAAGTFINKIDPVMTINITGAGLCK